MGQSAVPNWVLVAGVALLELPAWGSGSSLRASVGPSSTARLASLLRAGDPGSIPRHLRWAAATLDRGYEGVGS